MQIIQQRLRRLLQCWDELDIRACHPRDDIATADAESVTLAGGVYLRYDHPVEVAKPVGEIIKEVTDARVSVRLK